MTLLIRQPVLFKTLANILFYVKIIVGLEKERALNHKIILSILSGLFGLGVISSVLSFFSRIFYNPEYIYLPIFAVLIIVCISVFKHKERYNI